MIVRGWRRRRPSESCSRRVELVRRRRPIGDRRSLGASLAPRLVRGSDDWGASIGAGGTGSVVVAIGRWSVALGHVAAAERRIAVGPDAAVPAGALDDLRDGRHQRGRSEDARPGHELADRQGRQKAGRRRRVAVERGVGDADLEHGVRVRDGDAGQPVLARERGRPLVAAADEPRVVASTQSTSCAERVEPRRVAQQRAAEAVERVRDADQAALLARPRRSSRRPAARAGRPARGTGDEVAVGASGSPRRR